MVFPEIPVLFDFEGFPGLYAQKKNENPINDVPGRTSYKIIVSFSGQKAYEAILFFWVFLPGRNRSASHYPVLYGPEI